MALQTDLMGTGIAWPAAEKLGYSPQLLAAAGTSQTTAAVATTKMIEMTATGADGILLPNADQGTPVWVFNSSSSTGTVYVPVGHSLNTTINAGFALAAKKSAFFVQYKNKSWFSNLTA